jgi:hypothetical protein
VRSAAGHDQDLGYQCKPDRGDLAMDEGHCGLPTNVIEATPDRLREVDGIGPVRAARS